MKELTIEEKAKRYDEAVINGSRLLECGEITRESYEYIFPELKESEDERIRKDIISFVEQAIDAGYGIISKERKEKWIAWLEAQGEHANFRNKIQIGDKVTRNKDGVLVNLSQLKRVAKPVENKGEHDMGISEATKQKLEDSLNKALEKETPESWNKFLDEQEFANKVEPKFKVGDFIVNDYCFGKVIALTNDAYLLDTGQGIPFSCEHNAHLWTIQDAKDGDVLSFNDGRGNDCIELIKSITDKKIEFWFCLTNGNRYEVFDGIIPYTNLISREDATPATKEQRDLLFQKMKEAGYEWDAEKKELKKINPKFNVDDIISNGISEVKIVSIGKDNYTVTNGEIENDAHVGNWVIYFKDQDNWKLVEQKSAWSEEDKKMSRFIGNAITANDAYMYLKSRGVQVADVHLWLNKFKERYTWKPSDEQMDALRYVTNFDYGGHKATLVSLYEQLKKLK